MDNPHEARDMDTSVPEGRLAISMLRGCLLKYVVKHKSAKLFLMYAVGKLEAPLNISHLILSTCSQRVS